MTAGNAFDDALRDILPLNKMYKLRIYSYFITISCLFHACFLKEDLYTSDIEFISSLATFILPRRPSSIYMDTIMLFIIYSIKLIE